MANAYQSISHVNFDSKSYHVLLYGLNEICPKIEEIMYSENNKNRAGPWLFNLFDRDDPDINYPKVMIRECVGIPNVEVRINEKISHSQEINLITRFCDLNTTNNHYELTVLNLHDSDKSLILDIINTVVYMLRIRGFQFITPFISSIPFTNICHGEFGKIISLEDSGIRHYDTDNYALTMEDCQWVEDNIGWFYEVACLNRRKEFILSLDMLYASYSSCSSHAKLASIWVGIEALVKTDDQDISKTITKSLQIFGGVSKRNAKKFWGDSLGRCKIIHGVLSNSKTPLQLEERILEVRDVLCKMLQYFIEKKIIPEKANVYDILDKEILEEDSVKCLECDSQLLCPNCYSGLT